MGCGAAADLWWRGLRDFRTLRKDFGRSGGRRVARNGVGSGLGGGDGESHHSHVLHELVFGAPQQGQSRRSDLVLRLGEHSCAAKERTGFSSIAGHAPIARSSQNSGWQPPFKHNISGENPAMSRENPAMSKENAMPPATVSSSGQKDGFTEENMGPPPSLFMGYQLKRFSHFRDGHIHWRRYLHVKKDVRNQEGGLIGVPAKRCRLGTQNVARDPPMGAGQLQDLSDLTVICFDIETTGFSCYNDRIIEFAARDLAGGVCSTIETLVNPGREVKNAHIHKISSHMVNNPGVPRWRDVALAILDFVESRRKGQGLVLLVAHNGKKFDVPFIMTEFYASGLSIPSYWRFADSLALAKLAMKSSGRSPVPRTKLSQLFTYYNLSSVGDAHRAMADVNMLAQVLQMLMQDLAMSTSELLAQSFGASEIVTKPKVSISSMRGIVNGLDKRVVDMAALNRKKFVDSVYGSRSGSSAPWDRI